MCQINNASMEETLKAEVECLRKLLAEKDKEIQHLHEILDLYDDEKKEQEKKYDMLERTIDNLRKQKRTGEKL